jgi:predicted DNA-binding transcriptional regulator AlpA
MFNRREAHMSAVKHSESGPATRPRTRAAQPLHAAELADALLRLSTVEAITGLSRSTIYAKLKAGNFVEPVRLGARCTRFRAGDVQAWLVAQTA